MRENPHFLLSVWMYENGLFKIPTNFGPWKQGRISNKWLTASIRFFTLICQNLNFGLWQKIQISNIFSYIQDLVFLHGLKNIGLKNGDIVQGYCPIPCIVLCFHPEFYKGPTFSQSKDFLKKANDCCKMYRKWVNPSIQWIKKYFFSFQVEFWRFERNHTSGRLRADTESISITNFPFCKKSRQLMGHQVYHNVRKFLPGHKFAAKSLATVVNGWFLPGLTVGTCWNSEKARQQLQPVDSWSHRNVCLMRTGISTWWSFYLDACFC